MDKTQSKAMAYCHLAVDAGIPWAVIIQWIIQYGLPVAIQLLAILLPLLIGGKITVTQALEYAAEYLAAVAEGKQPPPPPA